jgi:hypothetical protein
MIDETGGDEAFAERVARPLRVREGADATFEARAMSAIHAVARAQLEARQSRSWWLRPRTIHLNPLATMALAAGFATLVWIGARATPTRATQGPTVAARADTVHVVRFVLVDSGAQRVSVVGAFNQWQKGATVMSSAGSPGVWVVEVPLQPGRHEYAFVVTDDRGERWVADPFSFSLHGDFGTETSVIRVGSSSS